MLPKALGGNGREPFLTFQDPFGLVPDARAGMKQRSKHGLKAVARLISREMQLVATSAHHDGLEKTAIEPDQNRIFGGIVTDMQTNC